MLRDSAMALSNAERQARWRKKRAELADRARNINTKRRRAVEEPMLVHGDSIHSKTVTGGTVGQTLKWHLSAPLEYHDEMRAAWVEATVALARKLQEARKLFASDKAFRLWLAENNLGFLSARDLRALLERDPEDNERSGLSAIPQPYAGRKAVT